MTSAVRDEHFLNRHGPGSEPGAPAVDARAETPRRSQAAAPVSVLVVDADRVSRKHCEDALAGASMQVESVRTLSAAIELLRSQHFDLVVTDTLLPDGEGFSFLNELKPPSGEPCPVVFFTAEDKASVRLRAYEQGAMDYIGKPCSREELVLRCKRAASRGQDAPVKDATRTALRGEIGPVTFADVVSMLEMSRVSGELVLSSDGDLARLTFDVGRLVRAQRGRLRGPHAFYKCAWTTRGEFEFTPGPCNVPAADRDIDESVTSLLIEGARQFDEAKTQVFGALPARRSSKPPPGQVRIRSMVRPTPELVSPLLQWLEDPFSLGRLRVWPRHQIVSGEALEKDRVLAVMVGDVSSCIRAMLEMASPPDETWVVDALSSAPKVVGLDLWVGRGIGVDLLFSDIAIASELTLPEVPAFAVIAPPDGVYRSVPVASKAALETALCQWEPRGIVAVGEGIEERILGLPPLRRATSTTTMHGALGRDVDLRSVLKEGIKLWMGKLQS